MKQGRWRWAGVLAIGALLCWRLAAPAQEPKGELRNDPPPRQGLNEPARQDLDVTREVEKRQAPAKADTAPLAEVPAKDATPPDLGPLQVTVFTDGQALVRRKETFALSVGLNNLEVDQVARRLDPSSVRLRPLTPVEGFRLLEQTSLSPTTSAKDLVAAAVGKPVKVRDGRYSVEGTLVAVEDDGVVVASDREVHVHPPGDVILPAGDRPTIAPRLGWQVESKAAGNADLEISYLTAGLTWAADYALTIGANDRAVAFEGWVRVGNTSGAAYGDVGLIFADGKSGTVADAKAEPKADAKSEPTGPVRRYFLPRKVALPDGASKRLSLVQAPTARSAVRYLAALTPSGPTGVRLVAELVNSASNGLGLPLPPGPVRLYAPDRLGRLDLVGQQSLPATPLDAPLRFDLGAVDDVEVKVVDSNPGTGALRRQVTLKNLRTEDVVVRVVEQRPGAWQVTSATAGFTPPKDGAATAEVVVPANQSKELAYQIRLGAGRNG